MSAEEGEASEARSSLLPRHVERARVDVGAERSEVASRQRWGSAHSVPLGGWCCCLGLLAALLVLSAVSSTLLLFRPYIVPEVLRFVSVARLADLCAAAVTTRPTSNCSGTLLYTVAPPSRRFVFNASGLTSSPVPSLLRAQRVLEVCFDSDDIPPVYWLGSVSMDGVDGPLVPLHRSVPGAALPPHCAAFVLPRAGVWTIELQQPQKRVLPNDDREPNHCIPLMTAPNFTRLHSLAQTSAVFDGVLHSCGWTADMTAEEGRLLVANQTISPPQSARVSERTIARHRFTVPSANDDNNTVTADGAEVSQQLYRSVYGNASGLLAHNALGYWQRRSASALPAPRTVHYQPEPLGCPTTFYFHNLTGDLARCNFTTPALQWHPTFGSRVSFLASPLAVLRYVNRTVTVVVGDSLGAAIWRGLRCTVRGYAAVQRGSLVNERVQLSHNAIDMLAMFPPLSALVEPSYAEFVQTIVRPPRTDGFQPGGSTVLVWNIGMWMVSHVSSSDWPRGLHRLMTFVEQYATERRAATGERQRHYFTTLTGVHTLNGQPKWQTATRVSNWNVLLLQVAALHRMPLIDLHSPSSVRADARLDNCHYCDTVAYELAHIVLARIMLNVSVV